MINFSLTATDALTQGFLNGDPIPINISFAGIGFIVGVVLVGFVQRESINKRQLEREEEENEDEGQRSLDSGQEDSDEGY